MQAIQEFREMKDIWRVSCDGCEADITPDTKYVLDISSSQSISLSMDFCVECKNKMPDFHIPSLVTCYNDRRAYSEEEKPLNWSCLFCSCALGGGREWVTFDFGYTVIIDVCLSCIGNIPGEWHSRFFTLVAERTSECAPHIVHVSDGIILDWGPHEEADYSLLDDYTPDGIITLFTKKFVNLVKFPPPSNVGPIGNWMVFMYFNIMFLYAGAGPFRGRIIYVGDTTAHLIDYPPVMNVDDLETFLNKIGDLEMNDEPTEAETMEHERVCARRDLSFRFQLSYSDEDE